MNIINLKQESVLLGDFISSIWAGTQGEWFGQMVEEIFMRGVEDYRYGSAQYINFAAAKEMGIDIGVFMDSRRKLTAKDVDYIVGADYDSLCLIHRFIDDVSTRVFEASWEGVSACSIEVVAQEMKEKYGHMMTGLIPLSYVEDEMHGYLVNDYKGFKGSHERSYSALERLSPHQSKNSVDSIGLDYYEWLTNSIYQHGMSCASNNNTGDILNVLVPFYKKYIDEPLMIGNGEALLKELSKSSYFSFLMELDVIKFPTKADLKKELKLEAELLGLANESPEEKAKRLSDNEAWMNNMLSDVVNFDNGLALKERIESLEKLKQMMVSSSVELPISE